MTTPRRRLPHHSPNNERNETKTSPNPARIPASSRLHKTQRPVARTLVTLLAVLAVAGYLVYLLTLHPQLRASRDGRCAPLTTTTLPLWRWRGLEFRNYGDDLGPMIVRELWRRKWLEMGCGEEGSAVRIVPVLFGVFERKLVVIGSNLPDVASCGDVVFGQSTRWAPPRSPPGDTHHYCTGKDSTTVLATRGRISREHVRDMVDKGVASIRASRIDSLPLGDPALMMGFLFPELATARNSREGLVVTFHYKQHRCAGLASAAFSHSTKTTTTTTTRDATVVDDGTIQTLHAECSFSDFPEFARRARAAFGERVAFLSSKFPKEEVNAEEQVKEFTRKLASAAAVISSALHGMIAAHAYEVPACAVTHPSEALGESHLKYADYFSAFSSSLGGSDRASEVLASSMNEALRSLLGEEPHASRGCARLSSLAIEGVKDITKGLYEAFDLLLIREKLPQNLGESLLEELIVREGSSSSSWFSSSFTWFSSSFARTSDDLHTQFLPNPNVLIAASTMVAAERLFRLQGEMAAKRRREKGTRETTELIPWGPTFILPFTHHDDDDDDDEDSNPHRLPIPKGKYSYFNPSIAYSPYTNLLVFIARSNLRGTPQQHDNRWAETFLSPIFTVSPDRFLEWAAGPQAAAGGKDYRRLGTVVGLDPEAGIDAAFKYLHAADFRPIFSPNYFCMTGGAKQNISSESTAMARYFASVYRIPFGSLPGAVVLCGDLWRLFSRKPSNFIPRRLVTKDMREFNGKNLMPVELREEAGVVELIAVDVGKREVMRMRYELHTNAVSPVVIESMYTLRHCGEEYLHPEARGSSQIRRLHPDHDLWVGFAHLKSGGGMPNMHYSHVAVIFKGKQLPEECWDVAAATEVFAHEEEWSSPRGETVKKYEIKRGFNFLNGLEVLSSRLVEETGGSGTKKILATAILTGGASDVASIARVVRISVGV